ncbi:MAG: RNA polymerase sigma factor RpoD/SigA [Prevotella sp.]|nr:RNA polymerase sigma factor RpoD/SigA [Prevotella sp.]
MRQLKIQQSITNRKNEALEKYLSEINHEPLISIDEEIELAQLIRKGGEEGERAKNKLITSNLRFVVSVAKQYQNQGMMLTDLIDEGNIGMIRAADSYDETRGFKFISYAVWWIRQRIQQAIAEQSRIVRLPQNQSGNLHKIKKEINKFEQVHRKPSNSELAEATNMDEDQIQLLMSSDMYQTSIDSPLKDDDDMTIGDVMAGEDKTDQQLEIESLRTDLNNILKSVLNEREIIILCDCFGINGKEKSYEEIGSQLGLTRERVRQIKENSLGKIRRAYGTEVLRKYLN